MGESAFASDAELRLGMPEGEYHADPALGSTDLKNLLRSPAHFRAAKETSFESDALRIGTLVHECILDPELWEKRVDAPRFDRRTKAGKAAAAQWAARVEAESLREVSKDDRALCEAMRESAMKHRLVQAALGQATQREVSCFWASDGVAQKSRMDAMAPGLVLDLKTTQDASASAFRGAVARYKYHVQAAHYSFGAHEATGVWPDYALLAIEKTPPYACAVYMLDEEALSTGVILRERALEIYRECVKLNQWPAYPEAIQTLSLPRWAVEDAGW